MASGSGDGQIPDFPRGLVDRRGTPAGKGRLTSLRGPRDLTLGGPPKRIFVPNIPPRKDRTKTEVNELKQDQPKPSTSKGKSRDKSRDKSERGRGRGGRGRGRGEENLIRIESVFSQGPSFERPKVQESSYESGARWGGGSGGGGGGRRKADVKTTIKTEYPDYGLDDLSDDETAFDDDDVQDGPDLNMTLEVLVVPSPETIDKDVKKKGPAQPSDDTTFERETEDGTADISRDSGDGQVCEPPRSVHGNNSGPRCESLPNDHDDDDELTPAEVFMRATKSGKEELMLLLLPFSLPGVPVQRTKEPEPEGSKSKDNDKENDGQSEPVNSSIRQFSEGYMGKLRVRKSGKVEFVLGDFVMEITSDVPIATLQEVVSVRMDEENKRMTMLGHVNHRMVVTPDYDTLLQQAKPAKDS